MNRLGLLILLTLTFTARGATFTVTTTAADGPGSLNEAIAASNANQGHDVIVFSIGTGVAVIQGTVADIYDDLTIDGRSQPGFSGEPLIVLQGDAACLRIGAAAGGMSEIRSLALRNSFASGIIAGSPVRLYGNRISREGGPGGFGVSLHAGASGSVIGGPSIAERNVIGGYDHGISLEALTDVSIAGNYIGVDATGTGSRPNRYGIAVTFAERITIGGTSPGSGNVISGNTDQGAYIVASDTSIAGNLIGTDASGRNAIPNGAGLYVTGWMAGGVTISGNVISGNQDVGVAISGTNVVAVNNLVGVSAPGSVALPNRYAGVVVLKDATEVDIGRPGRGNTISGTIERVGSAGGWGILVTTTPGPVRIRGNRIGLAAATDQPLPNRLAGIHIVASSGVTVGGALAGDSNRIEHNGGHGVLIGDGVRVTSRTVVEGNSIRSNLLCGVAVQPKATANEIHRNAIDDNGQLGVDLGGNGVTPNDELDRDDGPNRAQNFPELLNAVSTDTTLITGRLDSSASSTYTIEFFASPSADVSGHGEGAVFLGSTQVTTNASGHAEFSFVSSAAVPGGTVLSATATGSSGTSEFSNVLVTAATDIPATSTSALVLLTLGMASLAVAMIQKR